MIKIKSARILHLILLATVVLGLSQLNNNARKLNAAQGLWEEKGVENYSLELELKAMVGEFKFEVEAQAGQQISSRCIENCGNSTISTILQNEYTIDALFKEARNTDPSKGKLSKAEFDEDYGYPAYLYFDSPNVIDEEWQIRILKFTPKE